MSVCAAWSGELKKGDVVRAMVIQNIRNGYDASCICSGVKFF